MTRFLPYGRQLIEDDDIEAVAAALRDDYLTTGPKVAEFEAALAKTTGAREAIVCNSGTAALHLASLALGLGRGDQVIVPSITFLATANAPHHTGAEVIFADVDPESGLMTAASFAEALARAPRAKACFPVHLTGQTCDMAAIESLAETRGVALVEDACHALGALDGEGEPVGSCPRSAITAFSFHPVKAIAMGEGGAVTTNDARLASACRRMRNHGAERNASQFTHECADFAFDADGEANPWVYEMTAPGFNYRAPDILCALGLSQLRKLDRFIARRRALASAYDVRLGALAPLVRPIPRALGAESAWHLYAVNVDFGAAGVGRRGVMERMRAEGIGTQVHYVPVHLQPYYRAKSPDLRLPGAEAYYGRTLSLPIYPGMDEADVEAVVASLGRALGASGAVAPRLSGAA
jgi:UDP-4-amino-4,6-dideoxy-N-acetyl-beta-L-altrosamine transaminase